MARSLVTYRSCKAPQMALRQRLRELAAVRVSYGYRRLHTLLRREGWVINAKRVYRLYCNRACCPGPGARSRTLPIEWTDLASADHLWRWQTAAPHFGWSICWLCGRWLPRLVTPPRRRAVGDK